MAAPSLVVHCDWSTTPGKRWMSTATLEGGGYRLTAPTLVGDVGLLLRRLRESTSGTVLAGFDFPIGLPASYGRRTGLPHFGAFLETLRTGALPQWFDVVDDVRDLSIERPFYPTRPGGRSQQHLTQALGVESINELRRLCEQPTPAHGAACRLFWTLGGNQVGKAAIAGWREFVLLALAQGGAFLWPFDGALKDLVTSSQLVIAETYPADAYGQVGIRFGSRMSKRRQYDRLTFATALLEWGRSCQHDLDPDLLLAIKDGFGDRPDGEDKFDAVLGLCGMLAVVRGHRTEGVPAQAAISEWEGWILGQSSDHLAPAA
jgi:hypothetical protein